MANDEMKQIWKVPEPTLRRLPWYLAFLKLMKGRGEAFVSSTQPKKLMWTPVRWRKTSLL